MGILHALGMAILGYYAVAVLYAVVAPFVSRGVTFWSAFAYMALLPVRALRR